MANKTKTEKYTKATIKADEGIILEISKDNIKTYNIADILNRWDDVENVTITITSNEEILSDNE